MNVKRSARRERNCGKALHGYLFTDGEMCCKGFFISNVALSHLSQLLRMSQMYRL